MCVASRRLSVSDSVADHVLMDYPEEGAGLLVDEAGDASHNATASETADGGLGDALGILVGKD